MKPSECNSIADVLALDRSYESAGRFSMLIQHDGAVILSDHVPGQLRAAGIVIPRRAFQPHSRQFQRLSMANL